MNTTPDNTSNLLAHVSRIASAYIMSHQVPLEEVSSIIGRIYQTLLAIENNPHVLTTKPRKDPAVSIEDSVHDDYIVCLEDGKKLQMLKRHLSTMYGMTLEQYRERWNLPHDYPMVSPSYARRRSSIARDTGLGKNGRRKASFNKAA
jgi:predicted transcriptional regulator